MASEECTVISSGDVEEFVFWELSIRLVKNLKERQVGLVFTEAINPKPECFLLYAVVNEASLGNNKAVSILNLKNKEVAKGYGIKMELNGDDDPFLRKLSVSAASRIPDPHVYTNLDHPVTSFELARTGAGIGVADVRDLRTNSIKELRFDFEKTDLVMLVVPDERLNTLVLGWRKGYDPFVKVD